MTDDEAKISKLPKLTAKQENFVRRYYSNGKNAIEAYKFAYDAQGMKQTSIYKEAHRLLKHPKITPHLNYWQSRINDEISSELKYSVIDAFNSLLLAQEMAFDEKKYLKTTYSVKTVDAPNIQAFIKAEELKCKLMGLITDKQDAQVQTGGVFKVVVGGEENEMLK